MGTIQYLKFTGQAQEQNENDRENRKLEDISLEYQIVSLLYYLNTEKKIFLMNKVYGTSSIIKSLTLKRQYPKMSGEIGVEKIFGITAGHSTKYG